jgi:catechol 2,3-dioxygenase-like lactoylglutathione lyase family enzyme
MSSSAASGFAVIGLDHVQLAMPAGAEDKARAFYSGLLGLTEVRKPAHLARRGGVWFEAGSLKLHLGVEAEFRPAKKAHPALIVHNLSALLEAAAAAGYPPVTDEPLPGYDRAYLADPFGNRIEFLEPVAG